MQFIFFLLSLFAIGCVLYGISAGVQTIQRGVAWLSGSGANRNTTPATSQPMKQKMAHAHRVTDSPPQAGPLSDNLGDLRELFSLHKQGALTKEEYEQFKQCLLPAINPSVAKTNLKNP